MLGNQLVAQLVQAKRLTPEGRIIGLQPKLTVGAADDQYEQEADLVAHQVMTMPEGATNSSQRGIPDEKEKEQTIQTQLLPPALTASITPYMQRQMEETEETEEKKMPLQAKQFDKSARLRRQPEMEKEEREPIQAKPARSLAGCFDAGKNVESQLNRSKGGGDPLPNSVRAYMEPRFGMDFSHVRVHTGSEAVQLNRDVGAKAFTHGSDIYYGANHSPGNLELTAHEVTHVVQQTGSASLQPKRLDKVLPAVEGHPAPLIQRDKIPHGSLTWDDFKGKVPKKAKHDAATWSDFEDPELKTLIPDNAPVDTVEPCTVKGKDSTRFTVDIAIDSTKIGVKSFMDQDKSWHKSWTTDEAARRTKCEKEWTPKCKKAFDKQIAKIRKTVSKSKATCEKQFDKIKKEAAKQCKPSETECKAAFKRGDTSFTIEIGDSEIEANTAKECTNVLLPDCIAASMKGAEVSETVEGESVTATSKAECKTALTPGLEKLLKDQITWEASMGGASVTVKKLEDCSTTFVDNCATELLQAGSDELLKHEQTHFDLTQAMAEKAQNDLRDLVGTFPTEVDACGEAAAKAKAKTILASELAKMKKSYAANKKSMSKKQAQYDKETKHGLVEKKQTAWEEKISEGF